MGISIEALNRRRRICLGGLVAIPLAIAGCGARRSAGLPIGSVLPDVKFPVLDAAEPAYPLAGRPCLINFWATWCPPCRAEMASLNRLYLAYRSRGLGVLAVSVDEDIHLVREFLVKSPLAFPILLDAGGVLAKKMFGVDEFPTTFLVDRSRRVRDVWFGGRDWDDPEVGRIVAAMLAA